MPITLEMQDLVNVSFNVTAAGTQTSLQSENDWIDVGGWQDLVVLIWFQQLGSVSSTYPTAGFYLDNAPVKEETLLSGTGAASGQAPFQLATYNYASVSTPPLAGAWNPYGPFHLSNGGSGTGFYRYIRWRVIGFYGAALPTWSFRILLSGNPAPR